MNGIFPLPTFLRPSPLTWPLNMVISAGSSYSPSLRGAGQFMKIIEAIYQLAISLWAGGNAIFTLLLTPILFKTESRDTAARIVGNLFPAYFRWGLACGVIALICRLAGKGLTARLPVALLIFMLAVTSFQAFYLEPRVAALKLQIGSFETTAKDHPLRREFARLHGISAVCNLAVLASGVVLVVVP